MGRKVTRTLGINWIKELEDGDGEGKLEIGMSNKGPGGGSSSIARALAKKTAESCYEHGLSTAKYARPWTHMDQQLHHHM